VVVFRQDFNGDENVLACRIRNALWWVLHDPLRGFYWLVFD
jgi:hypothetical protein